MTDVQTTIETTDVKKPKFKKFKKLTVNDLLDRACWNPENFEEFQAWLRERNINPASDIKKYQGVRLYDIQLHCTQFVIRARAHENGGYQIFDFIEKDH